MPQGMLGRWLAPTLTGGTLLAVGIVVIGLAVAVVGGGSAHAEGMPLLEVLGRGGPAAVVAVGLVTLAVVPLVVLAVALVAFALANERRYVVVTLAVLALLLAGLVAAVLVSSGGG